jgi:hypothetical protein
VLVGDHALICFEHTTQYHSGHLDVTILCEEKVVSKYWKSHTS